MTERDLSELLMSQIEDQLTDGRTLQDVADSYTVSRSTISRWRGGALPRPSSRSDVMKKAKRRDRYHRREKPKAKHKKRRKEARESVTGSFWTEPMFSPDAFNYMAMVDEPPLSVRIRLYKMNKDGSRENVGGGEFSLEDSEHDRPTDMIREIFQSSLNMAYGVLGDGVSPVALISLEYETDPGVEL